MGAKDCDIHKEALERIQEAYTQDRENRDDAFTDLRFLANDQWPDAVRKQREAQNRPCLTINRLGQFVNQVANNVRQNPPAIKALPSGPKATQDIAEIYNGIFRQIQYRSNATNIYAKTEYYAVACGIGHFRLITQYVDDDSFDQEILIKQIPHPLSVYWDPAATEIDRSDADWCFVSEMVGRREFETRFPDASPSDFSVPSDGVGNGGLFWSTRDGVRLAEYWRKEPIDKVIARLSGGQIIDITGLANGQLVGLDIVAERKVRSHKIVQYLLSGSEVLDGPNEWAGRFIPIFPIIGSEIALEDKIFRHGLIRFARDPQQLYNYWRSAAAEAIALAPKAPWLVTPEMIAKFKGQWDTQNTVNRPYLLYEPDRDSASGAALIPRREAPPDIPTALIQEGNISSDEMKATTGVYDAALGARSNEISGVAIRARESQGDNSTLHYQDNMVATLHHLGRALVDLVPKIYDGHRIVSLLDEDDSTQSVSINEPKLDENGKQVLINDLSQGNYDIRVKVGPAYATRKQEAAESMLEFVRVVPQAAPIVGDLVARNMDWPGADEVANRLQKVLPPQLQPEPAEPEEIAQQKQVKEQAQAQQAKQQQFAEVAQQIELRLKNALASKAEAEAMKALHEAHMPANALQQSPAPEQGNPALDAFQDHHKAAQAELDTALKQEQLRRTTALANEAETRTQGSILDVQRKVRDLNQVHYQPIP